MKIQLCVLGLTYGIATAAIIDRPPLSYALIPTNAFTPSVNSTTTTILDIVKSKPELSNLTAIMEGVPGFTQAFSTATSWDFTFFAPSNDAFNNIGLYFNTFADSPKGKWWLGNLLQHHYVPNTALKSSSFNSTLLRFQTGSFLYVGAQNISGQILLNHAVTVVEADIPATNGLVHIIDHILDPSAQIFEPDLPKLPQSFIAGSCSNTALPYC